MKATIGGALGACLRAPLARWRLVLLLWLARLLPLVLAFGLPLQRAAAARSAHDPRAGLLLDPARDTTGYVYAWTGDFLRAERPGMEAALFWMTIFAWLLVTVLAGGITARLVRPQEESFGAACGRFAGRFVRLALIAAVLAYACGLLLDGVLAASQHDRALEHFDQRFAVERTTARSLLFVALLHLLGVLHAYARIGIVARERRSAVGALLGAVGVLLLRLPRLLLLETGLLAISGAAVLLAWVLLGAARPLDPSAGAAALVFWALAGAAGSYLRSGVELGALEARCRILAPAPALP